VVVPRTPAAVLELAFSLKRERPERTAAQVRKIMLAVGEQMVPGLRTLQSHLARQGLNVRADGRTRYTRKLWNGWRAFLSRPFEAIGLGSTGKVRRLSSPILYLRGLSTGDFRPALEDLLGEDASGLSASTISRLCKDWEAHHDRFRKRYLGFCRYAYLFVDGVHVSVRLGEDPKLCLLVVFGVREDGEKELLAVEDGYRESTESWAKVLRGMKRRGLNAPKLVVGDGALGAWAALRDVFPGGRGAALMGAQCWWSAPPSRPGRAERAGARTSRR
jgi:hypothetical protein